MSQTPCSHLLHSRKKLHIAKYKRGTQQFFENEAKSQLTELSETFQLGLWDTREAIAIVISV